MWSEQALASPEAPLLAGALPIQVTILRATLNAADGATGLTDKGLRSTTRLTNIAKNGLFERSDS